MKTTDVDMLQELRSISAALETVCELAISGKVDIHVARIVVDARGKQLKASQLHLARETFIDLVENRRAAPNEPNESAGD